MGNEYWVSLIGNLGFPVVVTFYLLVRLEKSLNDLESRVERVISEDNKDCDC